MLHKHGEGALFFALLATLVACSDPVGRTVSPGSSHDAATDAVSSQPLANEERIALSAIARLVAEAMDNEPARQEIKRAMRAAPFREHKLELKPFLQSRDGRKLLDRMAAGIPGGETAVFATLARVRPLEFYVPVAKHRETWNGKADVLVASQLDEREPIVAFDESGREVKVDPTVAPDRPTLSIVPVETRFDQPMPISTSRNVRDDNGEAIGTLEKLEPRSSSLIECGETCRDGGGGGGSGGTSSIPPGLYLEFSRILDLKEPWVRGDPEIEVHIHGPYLGGPPTYAEDLSCAGEHPIVDFRKYFDQNTGFWEGRALLFSQEEIAAFFNRYADGFHILFWEDDNQPCTMKLDGNPLADFVKSASQSFGSVAFKFVPKIGSWYLAGAVFVASMFANPGSWMLTNDDFVGLAIPQNEWSTPYLDNTHVIVLPGNVLNGRANIVLRQ